MCRYVSDNVSLRQRQCVVTSVTMCRDVSDNVSLREWQCVVTSLVPDVSKERSGLISKGKTVEVSVDVSEHVFIRRVRVAARIVY